MISVSLRGRTRCRSRKMWHILMMMWSALGSSKGVFWVKVSHTVQSRVFFPILLNCLFEIRRPLMVKHSDNDHRRGPSRYDLFHIATATPEYFRQ